MPPRLLLWSLSLALGIATGTRGVRAVDDPATQPAATTAASPNPVVAAAEPSDDWIDDRGLLTAMGDAAGMLLSAEAQRDVPTLAELQDQLKRSDVVVPDLVEPSHDKETVADIYARAKESVALVGGVYKCPNCDRWHPSAASGFFISPSGVLVTNYHVIAAESGRPNPYFAMLPSGRVFPLKEVLAADEAADIAIVQVDLRDQHGDDSPVPALPLATATATGQPAHVLSHPDGRYFALSSGIVSRRYLQRGTRWMTVTADYARGSSGGPVLDEHGSVIGLVASTNGVYYDLDDAGSPRNLQMVWKQCVPVENLRALIRPTSDPASPGL